MCGHQENTPPQQDDIEAEEYAIEIIFIQHDFLATIPEEEGEDEMDELEEGKVISISVFYK